MAANRSNGDLVCQNKKSFPLSFKETIFTVFSISKENELTQEQKINHQINSR